MATWNDLFLNTDNIALFPQTEVYKFIRRLENTFDERPLRIWDQCCGAGRHSILVGQMGHQAFSSDISQNGISYLRSWLRKEGLSAEIQQTDMTLNPWKNAYFHGAICWDAIYHNTIVNIQKTVETIRIGLIDGGLFIATLMSTKALSEDHSEGIERDTFVMKKGLDTGVPHHYFDKNEIKQLFKSWKTIILAEQVVQYIETEPEFWKLNPFAYNKWLVLMKK